MKKLLTLILVLFVMLIGITSCAVLDTFLSGGTSGGTTEEEGGGEEGGGTTEEKDRTKVYGKGLATNIILPAGSNFDASEFSNVIFDKTDGVVAGLRDDSSEAGVGEVVIGQTTRAISALAKTEMDKKLRKAILESNDEDAAREDLVAFTIYGEGGSIAIVWSSEVIVDLAVDYMLEEYFYSSSLDTKNKIVYTQVISLTEYYDELVADQRVEEWKKLRDDFIEFGCSEEQADKCIVAVQNFYAMADESVYLWLANLYDPAIGGFYYSNSARDTIGFLPDLESTLQGINIVKGNGMFDDFGETDNEKLRNAIPKEMQAQIVKFVQSCQSDVDGFFHHPQWEGMDSAWTSRLNRDLSWATGLLEWFGAKPLYALPTARGVNSDVQLTDRLGSSSVSMVSKVIAISAVPDHLETPEKWRAHLEEWDWAKSSYQAANTIGSQSNMIRSRGQEYIDILEEVLNEKQNPENGLWEDGVYYASVNGLMKNVACMNALGIRLQYAEEAFASAITMAKHTGKDEEGFVANHIVDVYNPWYAMDDLLDNVEKFGTKEEAASLRQTLIDEAVELIEVSMEKTAPFKKNDGSFGYNYDFSPDKSQGAPVSVPGTVEGDINGCVMALSGVIGNLLGTYGVYMPRRFYINDYFRFIEEIENLGEVIKTNGDTEVEPITFDDETVGSTEPDSVNSVSVPAGGIGQIELRTEDEDDKVLHIKDSSHTQGTSVRLTPGGVRMGASRCVVEFDIKVDSSTEGVFYQVFVGSTYQLTLAYQGGSVKIGDSSTKGVANDLGVSFPTGEWHTVRLEYYYTGDASTTVTKIYLDGAFRAESDNFYGKLPTGTSKPDLNFGELHLYTLYDPTVDMYLDNIYAAKDNGIYKEEEIVNPNRVSDFENSEPGTLAPGVTYKDYSGAAVVEVVDDPFAKDGDGADGKVLHFSAPGGTYVYKTAESLTNNGNAFVFDADVYFVSASEGGAITQTYFKVDGGQIFAFTFRAGEDNVGKYVELCTLNISNNTAKTPLAKIYVGKWTNLRIEYYRYQYQVGPDGNLWDGVKVRVLTDGVEQFNGLCDYPDPNALSKSVTIFQNYVLNGKSIDMYFDNMIFEITDLTYVDPDGNEIPDPETPSFPKGSTPTNTPAEKDHNGKFDFESAEPGEAIVPGLSTKPNELEYGNFIEIAEDPSGDNALKFVTVPSQKYNNSANFIADKTAPSGTNCQIFEFTINAVKADGDENFIQLHWYTSDNKRLSMYNILIPKGVKGEIAVTAREAGDGALSTKFAYEGGDVTIRFEYYEDNGITKLFVNGSFVGEGKATYSGTSQGSDTASVTINPLIKSKFELYIDDVTVSAVQKNYVAGNQ